METVEPTQLLHLMAEGLTLLRDRRIKLATADNDNRDGELIVQLHNGRDLVVYSARTQVFEKGKRLPNGMSCCKFVHAYSGHVTRKDLELLTDTGCPVPAAPFQHGVDVNVTDDQLASRLRQLRESAFSPRFVRLYRECALAGARLLRLSPSGPLLSGWPVA